MSFDLAAYQRDRIRTLELEVHGLQLARDQLLIALAGYIVRADARRQVESMPQDVFMAELDAYMIALESSTFNSRPEGHLKLVAKPLEKPLRPSSPEGTIAARLGNRELREA